MSNEITTPATKTQVDALIDLCLRGGFNEAAGLFQLGAETLSAAIKEEEKSETCTCYEYECDNPLCPDHGHLYQGEFSDSDIIDRSKIYIMGMGG